MSGLDLGRALRAGLLGRARALLHGLGPKGEYPSRVATLAIGGALCRIGYYLAKPGEALSNFGVEVSNLYCPCEDCQARRRK